MRRWAGDFFTFRANNRSNQDRCGRKAPPACQYMAFPGPHPAIPEDGLRIKTTFKMLQKSSHPPGKTRKSSARCRTPISWSPAGPTPECP